MTFHPLCDKTFGGGGVLENRMLDVALSFLNARNQTYAHTRTHSHSLSLSLTSATDISVISKTEVFFCAKQKSRTLVPILKVSPVPWDIYYTLHIHTMPRRAAPLAYATLLLIFPCPCLCCTRSFAMLPSVLCCPPCFMGQISPQKNPGPNPNQKDSVMTPRKRNIKKNVKNKQFPPFSDFNDQVFHVRVSRARYYKMSMPQLKQGGLSDQGRGG